ncbi:DUF485 domain-containing protein [Ornithinibacillus californiensis]|uniref:DUF485 domain-containing protein n=1 Tax=Ornithinibacillus californiensis TaxID=161536 RepID=UPI00064DBF14|nr:DUF485 domain-containing protein [Ornithinibacillus californiensis]
MEERIMDLIREKKRVVAPALVLVFIFYFMLPLSLLFFPDVMNQTSIIPGLTWAWLYGFLQIPMTLLMAWVYHLKAKQFDRKIEEIKREELS